MAKEITGFVKLQVKGGQANPAPPVGPALGSKGVNIMEFCKQFNARTQDKMGKVVPVLITVYADKSFDFIIKTAPAAVQLMEAANLNEYQTRVDAKPSGQAEKYSCHAFNANFAEVWVNEMTGMVRVHRHVAVTGAGRILNEKTARSQVIGGVVWGIGMALTEKSVMDPRFGNFITRTFADYHVPVNLDVGHIDVLFIPEEDKVVNKLGVKGIGEVGIVGVAGAIANAVFNATGKRVRDLPITPDKLV